MSAETDQIKERLDVAEIVGEYVQLKRAGAHYKGLCPFHNEKTPSFIVSPEKGIWHCFGCSEGGDVITFVQKMEGLDFPAALKMLAERAGVELKNDYKPANDQRARLFEMSRLAAKFYHEILMRQPAGKKALKYLLERGLRKETLERLSVGYAIQSWDGLRLWLERKGYKQEDMMAAGLVARNARGKIYDRFRGRIMFPIYDVQGRVVAFGGRITPWHATGEEGKYINSPETVIYEKRRVVYNLNQAKRDLRRHEPCLVVEGYMDVAMMVQSGVANVVASSGTAFTTEQVALLKRYTDVLHFAFDGDSAGVKAAQAATREAAQAGMRVAAVLFPAGEDPADVAKRDPKELKRLIGTPTSLAQFLLNRLRQGGGDENREEIIENMLAFVRQATNLVQQGEMVQEIATALHVPETVLLERLGKVTAPMTWTPLVEEGERKDKARFTGEHYVLGLLIAEPTVRSVLISGVSMEQFSEPELLRLYVSLRQMERKLPNFEGATADAIVAAVPEEDTALAEALRRLAEEARAVSGISVEAEAAGLVQRLKRRMIDRELEQLQRQLSDPAVTDKGAVMKKIRDSVRKLAAVQAV